jgi:hypothetical protein
MSDLQRALAQRGLPAMPSAMFGEAEGEEEADRFDTELQQDDDSSSASSASSASSTGTIIPSQNQKLFARPQGSVSFHVHLYDMQLIIHSISGLQVNELWIRYLGQLISNANFSSSPPPSPLQ